LRFLFENVYQVINSISSKPNKFTNGRDSIISNPVRVASSYIHFLILPLGAGVPKKSPPHCEGLLSESLSYFFFLAAFFLGAAFFLAAFFLVAMCLEFKWLEINNDSKNRIII